MLGDKFFVHTLEIMYTKCIKLYTFLEVKLYTFLEDTQFCPFFKNCAH